MKHATDVLDHATELIRQGHAQGANALDADGKKVNPFDPTAVAWDACGALLVAGRDAVGGAFSEALHAFAEAAGVTGFEAARDWRCDELPALTRQMCEQVWEWEDAIPPALAPGKVALAFKRAKENL